MSNKLCFFKSDEYVDGKQSWQTACIQMMVTKRFRKMYGHLDSTPWIFISTARFVRAAIPYHSYFRILTEIFR